MKSSSPARDINPRAKKSHPLEWLFELLEDHPAYMRRRFFGGEAVYVGGRLALTLMAKEEPWNGVFVITGREHHASLQKEWPALKPHIHIPKWLYLSQGDAAFEAIATAIIRAVRREDPRIGIEPKTKGKKTGKKPPAKRAKTAKGRKRRE